MENNFEELQDDLKNLELIALNEKAEDAVAVAVAATAATLGQFLFRLQMRR